VFTAADGAKRRYSSERKRPNLCRTESRARDGNIRIQGYNGKTAWSLSNSGPVRILAGAEAQDRIDECEFDESPLLDHAQRGIVITYAGLLDVDGAKRHRVDVMMPSGAKRIIYIDPSTSLDVRTDYVERDGSLMVQRVLDRRVFAGASFPTAMVATDATGAYPLRLDVESIEINVAIPDERFDPPTAH